jgi:hypothetical protein
VSLPVRELTRNVGLIAGEDGRETASVVVAALAARGRPVMVLDCDGSFGELSTPPDACWCHAGSDADCRLETGSTDEVARRAYRTSEPIVVDGPRTDEGTLAALTRTLLERSATDDRRLVTVVCGLGAVLPDDGPVDERGRAIRRLVTQGPDRGLGVCAVTDRPAGVDATVRETGAWAVWHRLTRTADTSVVRRELGGERAQAVRDLPAEEAFLATEWTAAVERVSVRRADREHGHVDDHTGRPPTVDSERSPSEPGSESHADPERITDRLAELTATVDDRLDPDRLAADIADALEPRLEFPGGDSGGAERSSKSAAAGGSTDTDGSAGSDGFAGFDVFDEGAGEAEPDTPAESSATDGLAALAGVGDDQSETPSATRDGTGNRAVSDGGLDVDSVSAEVAAFEGGAAAVETDAERAGGKPAVVVDVESSLAELDAGARAMLEHYRADGPARPEAAHSAATGQASRLPAYTLNRELRRAGLIEHVGRGCYDYSLRDRIEAGLPADRDDEMAAVYARDIEQAALD